MNPSIDAIFHITNFSFATTRRGIALSANCDICYIKLFSGCAGGEEAEEDGHHRSLGPLRQTQTIRLKGRTGLFKFSDIFRERF